MPVRLSHEQLSCFFFFCSLKSNPEVIRSTKKVKIESLHRLHVDVKKSCKHLSNISWSKNMWSLRLTKKLASGFSFVGRNAYASRFSGCSACTNFSFPVVFQQSALDWIETFGARIWHLVSRMKNKIGNTRKCTVFLSRSTSSNCSSLLCQTTFLTI